jgi:hypothetical protein
LKIKAIKKSAWYKQPFAFFTCLLVSHDLNIVAMKRTQLLVFFMLFAVFDLFAQGIVNFSGVIKDSQTGDFLDGINILIVDINTGTLSDFNGEFFAFFAGGTYCVNFSSPGYKPEKITFDLREDKFVEVMLTPTEETRKKNEISMRKKLQSLENARLDRKKNKTANVIL